MRPDSKSKIDRRDLLRVLGAGAGAVATPDVKAFYRVNNYPK